MTGGWTSTWCCQETRDWTISCSCVRQTWLSSQKGPPKTLRTQLAKFASRTNACRKAAKKIARELGLDGFLRQDWDTSDAGNGLSCALTFSQSSLRRQLFMIGNDLNFLCNRRKQKKWGVALGPQEWIAKMMLLILFLIPRFTLPCTTRPKTNATH